MTTDNDTPSRRRKRSAASPLSTSANNAPVLGPTEPQASAATAEPHRVRIFVIDSGWKSPSAQVVRDNFSMILSFQGRDPFYVLTRKQSRDIIRRNPVLAGKDPIILVRDLHQSQSQGNSGDEFHGFHLNLGLLHKPNQVLDALRQFLLFLTEHRGSVNIERDIREKLHRDGLAGTIEVIRAGAQEAMAG